MMRLRRNRGATKGICRCRLWMVVCMALCLVSSACWAVSASPDPYKVLGVSRRASSDEIKKCYRKLCLRYHPDKNVQKPAQQRRLSDRKFKQVRHAYDVLLNKDGGIVIDVNSAKSFFDNLMFLANNPGIFWREMKMLNLFALGSPIATRGCRHPGEPDVKSIYQETIKVPLEELYKGIPLYRLELQDNIFKRIWASIRGKFFFYSMYQASCLFFAIYPHSKVLAWVAGLYVVHGTTPVPDPKANYFTTLARGTREKTVRFAKWRHLEVVFCIQEADHSMYRRIGDDLHVKVALTSREAKKGCSIVIPALDPSNEPEIEIAIPAKKYSYKKEQKLRQEQELQKQLSGDEKGKAAKAKVHYDNTIRVKGRGWPTRKRAKSSSSGVDPSELYSYGDLIVTIQVDEPTSKKKKKTTDQHKPIVRLW